MDIESEVRQAITVIGRAKENLLHPSDMHKVLKRALELRDLIGHRKALHRVLEEFAINTRSPKEIEAYRSFINAGLTPRVKRRVKVGMRVTREIRSRYEAEKPDPAAYQEDLEKKFP